MVPEAIIQSLMENQGIDALPPLPKQSIRYRKIKAAPDSLELDNFIAIAVRCTLRPSIDLYGRHDFRTVRRCLVSDPEIPRAEQ